MQKGDIVYGIVTGIKDYGAFIKIDDYNGLIHISEFSDGFVKDIKKIVELGDIVCCKVLEIDDKTKHVKLSYKDVNLLASKVYRYVKIKKGFNSLAINLDKWIDCRYNELKLK